MKGGGHFGLGMVSYVTVSTLLGFHPSAVQVVAAGLIGLLPDVDVVLNIDHRKYTHSPFGIVGLAAFVFLVSYILPLDPYASVAALLSHYAADFAYCDVLKRYLPIPPKNPVDAAEYISTAVMSASAVAVILELVFPKIFSPIIGTALVVGGVLKNYRGSKV